MAPTKVANLHLLAKYGILLRNDVASKCELGKEE